MTEDEARKETERLIGPVRRAFMDVSTYLQVIRGLKDTLLEDEPSASRDRIIDAFTIVAMACEEASEKP